MYADNNGGYTPATSRRWQHTMGLLRYGNSNKLLFCPMATKFSTAGGRHPFAAYQAFSFGPDYYSGYGSYGVNGWICNPSPQVKINSLGLPTSNNWRRVSIKGAENVPLFLDSMWIDSYPDRTNAPPPVDDYQWNWGEPPIGEHEQMSMFCINRHDEVVNSVLLDFSARKVGLKELWKLKWHRKCDTNAPTPEWPDWMRRFKDY